MDELEQETTEAEKWQDIRDGIYDAAVELCDTLDEIIEALDDDKPVDQKKLDWIDDPAGTIQMHLEELYKLQQAAKTPKLQIVRNPI